MPKSDEKLQNQENTESRTKGADAGKTKLDGFADMLATSQTDTGAESTQEHAEIETPVPTPKDVSTFKVREIRPAGDSSVGSLSAVEFESQRKRFWNENGVDITKKDGRLEYRMYGHKETLTSSDATPQGIEEAHKKIEQLRVQKITDLAKEYGAKFSIDGETAGKQNVYDQKTGRWVKGTEDVHVRAPKLHELLGVEAALKVSQPSAHGVKFYFMTNQLFKNVTEMADCHGVPVGGSDKSAKPNDPAIFLNARLTMNYPPTEAVAKNWFGRDMTWTSLETTLVHELVHHSENTMNWDVPVGKTAITFGREIANKMGWDHPKERDTNKFLFQDKDGNYWKHEHLTGNEWVKMRLNGQPLDAKGNPCTYDKIHRITNADMVEIARVRPGTTYNDTPKEMFADGMTMFRAGRRADLWQNNRALYNVLKDADQREINKAHPLDKNKKPTHIRAVDGRIVANTAAAQTEIQKLEK